jgi:hypothetical protein
MQSRYIFWLNRMFSGLNSIRQKYHEKEYLQISILVTIRGYHMDQVSP